MMSPARLKALAASMIPRKPAVPPAQLQPLLDRVTLDVKGAAPGVCQTAARRAVLEAWSEIAAEQSMAYVDLEASTPQLLVLVDEVTKTRRLFPVADLVRILGPRSVAA